MGTPRDRVPRRRTLSDVLGGTNPQDRTVGPAGGSPSRLPYGAMVGDKFVPIRNPYATDSYLPREEWGRGEPERPPEPPSPDFSPGPISRALGGVSGAYEAVKRRSQGPYKHELPPDPAETPRSSDPISVGLDKWRKGLSETALPPGGIVHEGPEPETPQLGETPVSEGLKRWEESTRPTTDQYSHLPPTTEGPGGRFGPVSHEALPPEKPGPLARLFMTIPNSTESADNKLAYQAEQNQLAEERAAKAPRDRSGAEAANRLLSRYGVPTVGPGGERVANLSEQLAADPRQQELITNRIADGGVLGWLTGVGAMWTATGDAIGSETISEQGHRLEYAAQGHTQPEELINREEIETPAQGIEWAIQTVAQGLGSMLPVFGGMAAGAAAGSVVPGVGTAIGGIAGAIVGSFPLMFHETSSALDSEGITGSAADVVALGAATIASLLEIAIPLRLGSKMIPGAEKAVQRGFVQAVLRMAKEGTVEGAGEALTEGVQNQLPALAQAALTEGDINDFSDPDHWIETGIEAAVGFLLGGTFGVGAGLSTSVSENVRHSDVENLSNLLNDFRPEGAELSFEDVDFGYDIVMDAVAARAASGKDPYSVDELNAVYEEILLKKALVEAMEEAQSAQAWAQEDAGESAAEDTPREPPLAPELDRERLKRINEGRVARGEEPFTEEYVRAWATENDQRRDVGERRRIDKLPPEKIEELNVDRAERGMDPLVQRPMFTMEEEQQLEGNPYLSSASGGTRDTPQLRAAAAKRAKKNNTTVEEELKARDEKVRSRIEQENAGLREALNLSYEVLENLDDESRARIVEEWESWAGPKNSERIGSFLQKRGLAEYDSEAKAFVPTGVTSYERQEAAQGPEAPTTEPTPTTPQPEAQAAAQFPEESIPELQRLADLQRELIPHMEEDWTAQFGGNHPLAGTYGDEGSVGAASDYIAEALHDLVEKYGLDPRRASFAVDALAAGDTDLFNEYVGQGVIPGMEAEPALSEADQYWIDEGHVIRADGVRVHRAAVAMARDEGIDIDKIPAPTGPPGIIGITEVRDYADTQETPDQDAKKRAGRIARLRAKNVSYNVTENEDGRWELSSLGNTILTFEDELEALEYIKPFKEARDKLSKGARELLYDENGKLSAELDITQIEGSGKNGTILKTDVQRALKEAEDFANLTPEEAGLALAEQALNEAAGRLTMNHYESGAYNYEQEPDADGEHFLDDLEVTEEAIRELRNVSDPTPAHEHALELLEQQRAEIMFGDSEVDGETAPRESVTVWEEPAETVNADKVAKAAGESLSAEEANERLESWKAEADRQRESGVNANKVVISMYDRTQVWAEPFARAGYIVYTMDRSAGGDVFEMSPPQIIAEAMAANPDAEIVGILSAPPCCSFAGSGARWWANRHDINNPDVTASLYGEAAAKLNDTPLDAAKTLVHIVEEMIAEARSQGHPVTFHALENPVGRIASETGMPAPTLKFNPNNYGDPYTKQTNLWGTFNPDLPQANVEPTEGSRAHKLRGDVPLQKQARSDTPQGFAYAFFMAQSPAVEPAVQETAVEELGEGGGVEEVADQAIEISDAAMSAADKLAQSGKVKVAASMLEEVYAALEQEWELSRSDVLEESRTKGKSATAIEWVNLALTSGEAFVREAMEAFNQGEDFTIEGSGPTKAAFDKLVAQMDEQGWAVQQHDRTVRARKRLPPVKKGASNAEAFKQGYEWQLDFDEGFPGSDESAKRHYAFWAGVRRVLEKRYAKASEVDRATELLRAFEQETMVGVYPTWEETLTSWLNAAANATVEAVPDARSWSSPEKNLLSAVVGALKQVAGASWSTHGLRVDNFTTSDLETAQAQLEAEATVQLQQVQSDYDVADALAVMHAQGQNSQYEIALRQRAKDRRERVELAQQEAEAFIGRAREAKREAEQEYAEQPVNNAKELVPLDESGMKYSSASFTNKSERGNVVESDKYVSNGHILLVTEHVPKKNQKRLAKIQETGPRNIADKGVQQLLDLAEKNGRIPAVLLGVRDTGSAWKWVAYVAYRDADGQWDYAPFQAQYLKIFDALYGGNIRVEVSEKNPGTNAISFYQGDKFLGVVMPLRKDGESGGPLSIHLETAMDALDFDEDTSGETLGRAAPEPEPEPEPQPTLWTEADQAEREARGDPLNPERGVPESATTEGMANADPAAKEQIGSGLQGELEGLEGVKPTSRREVFALVAKVAEAAGKLVPLRVGRIAQRRALGIFKVGPEVTRIRHALDLPTAMHEIAHATEKVVFGWPKGGPWKKPRVTGTMQQELIALGKALYGDEKPAGGYKREGFAEFWRRWFENDETLRNDAPKFYEWFENDFLDATPELRDAATAAREAMGRWQDQGAVARTRESIVDMASPRERLARTRSSVRRMLSMESLVEMGQPLYEMAKRAEEMLGRDLTPSENPFTVLSALRTTQAARTRYMVERGMIDLAGNRVGPALNDIRALVKGQQRNFAAYLFARRAIALWTDPQGARQPGISFRDAQQVVKELHSPEFEKAAAIVYRWADGTLDYAAEASPMFADVVQRVRERDPGNYIPLQRIFHEIDSAFQKQRGDRPTAGPDSPVRRLTGAMRDIKDPIATLIGQTEQLLTAAHRRMVLDRIIAMSRIEGMGDLIEQVPKNLEPQMTRTVKTLLDAINQKIGPEAEAVLELEEGTDEDDILEELITFWAPAQFPKGKDPIIVAKVGDNYRWYYVDPRLYDVMASLDVYRLPEWNGVAVAEWALGKPASAFRAGTTGLRASFGLLWNPTRDVQTMAVNSQANASMPRMLGYWLKSMMDVALFRVGAKEASATLDTFLALGGEMAQPLGQDIPHTRLAARKIHQGRAVRTLDPRNWFEFYRDLVQMPESAPRLAELKGVARDIGWEPGTPMSLDQSLQLLLAAKQVTTDFTAAGSWARFINRMVPFHNAAIQGPRANLRAARNNPAKFMARGLQLTALSLLLWYENRDKEWYKTLPYRDRYLHWWFDAPNDELVRLPRAFEAGMVFAALPEMALDAWYRQDPDAALAWFTTFLETSRPPGLSFEPTGGIPLPVFENPLFEETQEQFANRDFFFDRPLVPMGELNKPAEEQFNEFTSRAAIVIGDIFNMSPRRIDHFIQGVFGYVGGDILDLIGLGEPGVDRDRELADLPVVGRAFRRGGETGTRTKQIDELYTELEAAQIRQQSDRNPETPEQRQGRLQLNDAARAVTVLMYIRSRVKSVEDRRTITREAQRIAEAALAGMSEPATEATRGEFRTLRREAEAWKEEFTATP